jgi:hypothetical protein
VRQVITAVQERVEALVATADALRWECSSAEQREVGLVDAVEKLIKTATGRRPKPGSPIGMMLATLSDVLSRVMSTRKAREEVKGAAKSSSQREVDPRLISVLPSSPKGSDSEDDGLVVRRVFRNETSQSERDAERRKIEKKTEIVSQSTRVQSASAWERRAKEAEEEVEVLREKLRAVQKTQQESLAKLLDDIRQAETETASRVTAIQGEKKSLQKEVR